MEGFIKSVWLVPVKSSHAIMPSLQLYRYDRQMIQIRGSVCAGPQQLASRSSFHYCLGLPDPCHPTSSYLSRTISTSKIEQHSLNYFLQWSSDHMRRPRMKMTCSIMPSKNGKGRIEVDHPFQVADYSGFLRSRGLIDRPNR